MVLDDSHLGFDSIPYGAGGVRLTLVTHRPHTDSVVTDTSGQVLWVVWCVGEGVDKTTERRYAVQRFQRDTVVDNDL